MFLAYFRFEGQFSCCRVFRTPQSVHIHVIQEIPKGKFKIFVDFAGDFFTFKMFSDQCNSKFFIKVMYWKYFRIPVLFKRNIPCVYASQNNSTNCSLGIIASFSILSAFSSSSIKSSLLFMFDHLITTSPLYKILHLANSGFVFSWNLFMRHPHYIPALSFLDWSFLLYNRFHVS